MVSSEHSNSSIYRQQRYISPAKLTHDDLRASKLSSTDTRKISRYPRYSAMAPIKVGLMGYGFSTKSFHVPFILPNPDLEVYAFLQRAEAPKDKSGVEKGKHCTVDHPNAKHYRTADDFFADKDIELVIVCTGVDTHAKFAEQAMRSGKHGMSSSARYGQ